MDLNKHITLLEWRYAKDLDEINKAILKEDKNWYGLKSSDQIISIKREGDQYLVIWNYTFCDYDDYEEGVYRCPKCGARMEMLNE